MHRRIMPGHDASVHHDYLHLPNAVARPHRRSQFPRCSRQLQWKRPIAMLGEAADAECSRSAHD